jgi:hypothetical protein
MLVRQPVSGGKAEPIADLKEYGIERVKWLEWSPDGSRLALACPRDHDNDPLASWGQLMFARVEGGRLQKTRAIDLGLATWTGRHTWSTDSTHVAYTYEGLVAVRPEARLYEVAVDNIVERIEAGAIAPTEPKAAQPAAARIPPEVKPTPQPEPIMGSVFSDNFDNGLSKHWQITDWNSKGSPAPTHAVENGQLMLSNCIARLSQIDWTDYRVTVRVCVKEVGASGRGSLAILTRTTPSNFGANNQYAMLFLCNNDAPASSLGLALHYHIASGVRHGAGLGKNPCTLVQGKWYKLAFEVRGDQLRAFLDDTLVIEATDARLTKGAVWITAPGSPVLFDDFSVRRLP